MHIYSLHGCELVRGEGKAVFCRVTALHQQVRVDLEKQLGLGSELRRSIFPGPWIRFAVSNLFRMSLRYS